MNASELSAPAVVVFTRDLRVADHPALAAAAADPSTPIVPLFVFDDAILRSSFNRANRTGFLLDSLADLDDALCDLGAPLVVRWGDWVEEVMRVASAVGAAAIHVSDDVSGYARARLARLRSAAAPTRTAVTTHPGATVIEPGEVVPAGGDCYQVFTPYYRRWLEAPRRVRATTPVRLVAVDGLPLGSRPELGELTIGGRVPAAQRGGLRLAEARLDAWVGGGLGGYGERRDDLLGDSTSRLSAFLHFGCVSPLDVVRAVEVHPGADPFVRQVCWRDFYAQLLAARPDLAWSELRPRGNWIEDPEGLAAWREGRTGVPVVDAAMRQLVAEGFVPNRARMIVASFLTKDLGIDWREGARHFLDHLVDGDVANNNLGWQWVAGTGTDSNPHRVFNPTLQGQRFDPDGDYVRRYVPELAGIAGGAVHEPEHYLDTLGAPDYPPAIVDHHHAMIRYRASLGTPGGT